MNERPTILLDGDDTLWSTQPLYEDAKQALYALVAKAGLDEAAARAEFDALDLANVQRLGFSVDRFPTSMREMVSVLRRRSGGPPDPSLEDKAEQIGRRVHGRTPELDPDAKAVLKELRKTYRLVLYTMGDPDLQRQRVHDLDIRPLLDGVVVSPLKTAQELRRTIATLDLDPRSTWYVGNSARSDIGPARAAELRAVWLRRRTWDYDDGTDAARLRSDPGVIVIGRLAELPTALGHFSLTSKTTP